MELAKITQIRGQGIPIPGDDIDTDRIIPARFMKCVTFDGLGDFLFHDVRKDEQGNTKEHPLNDPRFAKATIMIAGSNFGCGSSREHAPQAIYRAGYRAVIAEGFAEIFFGNSTNLGIPCVSVSHEDRVTLQKHIDQHSNTELILDLEQKTVECGTLKVPFVIREGARQALVEGKWDPLGELMEGSKEVGATAAQLGYV